MIIAYFKHDNPTLKACAATCFCWYNIAFPHLHRTLTLWDWISKEHPIYPHPLLPLFKLGLLLFVEELNFSGTLDRGPWVVPAVFDSRSMRCFRAMVNLQELNIGQLDFYKFPVGFGKHLGHFAPTLRSVGLAQPCGPRRQLLDFFRLFPKLDDIKITHYSAKGEAYEPLDAQLVPINGGLRGRLILKEFEEDDPGLLEDMIVAFGGMRFTSMDLWDTTGTRRLLGACADTLEVLRICSGLHHCKRDFTP